MLIIIYLVAAYYFSWWPLDDTERAVNNSNFNVYFYYPNGNEKYLGSVSGLPSCSVTANNFAYVNSINDWTYVCCRIADGSGCKSKHK